MKEPLSIGKRIKNIAPVRLIVISFALVILIGATLLTLPISARDGQATNFVDALFTATSATCVTGLVVVDTWTHFNGFGQAVILFLIQVGGLGIVDVYNRFYCFNAPKVKFERYDACFGEHQRKWFGNTKIIKDYLVIYSYR